MNAEYRLTNASFSTMWAIKKYHNLPTFFQVATKLGFQYIELNHQVNSEMLVGIDFNQYQFSSIHEPCPADIPTKVLSKRDWLISSPDEASRVRGVQAIQKSIDLASKIGAPVVVIHCGNVSLDLLPEIRLRRYFEQGQLHSEASQDLKSELIRLRKALVPPRIRAVKKSLLELLDYAQQFKIRLGLENRYHYMDIPSIDEMELLLGLADLSRLGFIYDVGHAQALDRLGFYPHGDWLRRYYSRIFGSHLHDVIGVADHYAPGLGEIDFKTIAGYLPDNSFRTLELSPTNTVEQVSKGISYLVKQGCIKYI